MDRAIARIYGSTEKTKTTAIGVGFWVFPGYLLTCAHVVNQALGLKAESQPQPEGVISLDFPFSGDNRRFEGRVKVWRSVERSKIGRDIAVLTIAGSVPDDVVPIALVEVTGLPLICKGFPVGYDAFTLSAEMTAMTVASNGYVQLENPQGRVAPGFSGGPVWEKGGTGVVGMIVEADVGKQVAFMISAGVLRSVLGLPGEEKQLAKISGKPSATRAFEIREIERLYKKLAAVEADLDTAMSTEQRDARYSRAQQLLRKIEPLEQKDY